MTLPSVGDPVRGNSTEASYLTMESFYCRGGRMTYLSVGDPENKCWIHSKSFRFAHGTFFIETSL
jgi:hypothetical protein